MSTHVPSSYSQEPVSGYVEQVETFGTIQEGVNAAREAREINERIAREIGRTAIQGYSGN